MSAKDLRYRARRRHQARCGRPLKHIAIMPPRWAVVAYALFDAAGQLRTLPHLTPRAHAFPVEQARRRALPLSRPASGRPFRPGDHFVAWLHVGPSGRRRRVTSLTPPEPGR